MLLLKVTVVLLIMPALASCVEKRSSKTTTGAGAYSGKVLLVSMDGFRWDYLKTVTGLSNFSRLAASGCSVDRLNSPFATKTFPCHYTIATGLYEESHGIVSNSMYDPVHNATFVKHSLESFWWDGGEPIWVTAERQNKRSGVYFWPGSEAEIRGHRPSTYMPYNQSAPFPQRVQTAIQWLKDGSKDLVLLYFHEPDRTGHVYGPESPQIQAKVKEMDGVLGMILDSMEENKLNDVNIIVTSDHGMTDIDVNTRLLNLWNYVNQSMVERVPDSGTVTAILPAAGREAEVVEACRKIPHVTVYRKEEIPDHFHYKHNPRIMPVIILSDEGWLLSANMEQVIADNERGNHGFSNELASMKAIFLARGPDFRKGVHSASIRTVDIYPLVCRLLNIDAAPNNGSLANTVQFLLNGSTRLVAGGHFSWLYSSVCVVLLGWCRLYPTEM
ncbi:hypothetical protein ACOMHN_029188 [Nucella lapillus]